MGETWPVDDSVEAHNGDGKGDTAILIAGDIGGTKTLLALFSPEGGPRNPVLQTEFPSAGFRSLDELVREFLDSAGASAAFGCFGVAGPVIRGRAHLTNLAWTDVDADELSRSLGLREVWLLNDLQAIAYAVPHLHPADIHTLNDGRAEERGSIGVIAPGTGLGEAFLVWDGSRYLALASEGGHADFGPTDETQSDLLAYLRRTAGHVDYESVCSGRAIPHLYAFFRDTGRAVEAPGFASRLAAATDPTPLIVEAALRDPTGNPLCAAALETLIRVLGAEAGNLALKVMATGGVYLSGGLPARLIPQLEAGSFMSAFTSKGRHADLVGAVPVHVVTIRAALLGAAAYGLEHMAARSLDSARGDA